MTNPRTTPPARRNNQAQATVQQQPAAPPAQAQVAPEEVLRRDIASANKLFEGLLGGSPDKVRKFMAGVYQACRVNPKLLAADRGSLLMAIGEVAALDLSPNPLLQEAWLIPRWNKNFGCETVSFQIGVQGLIQLLHRGNDIDWMRVEVVRRGEHWREDLGTDPKIEHSRPLEGTIDESDEGILAAYCVIQIRGSSKPYVEVVRRSKLIAAAERSGDPRNKEWSNIWRDNFEEMAKKTAIRRISKRLPKSTTRDMIDRDSEIESGNNPGLLVEGLRDLIARPPQTAVRQSNRGLDSLLPGQPEPNPDGEPYVEQDGPGEQEPHPDNGETEDVYPDHA